MAMDVVDCDIKGAESLLFSRRASRICATAPQASDAAREQGGLLTGVAGGGLLGDWLVGDNR